MGKIGLDFYQQDDVVTVARELLGKHLYTRDPAGNITAGIITETEAYEGVTDRACHAYQGKCTKRTQVMYHQGGVAYVYLCYGIHSLLNIVTNTQGTPHAVLIRALQPTIGMETMLKRRGRNPLSAGPGTLTQALGISLEDNGHSLTSERIWLEDQGHSHNSIEITPRIGIDYAQEDALLPYRFLAKEID